MRSAILHEFGFTSSKTPLKPQKIFRTSPLECRIYDELVGEKGLFTEAEGSKNAREDILRINTAGDRTEGIERGSEVYIRKLW